MKLSTHANKLETNVVDAQTQDFGIGDASVVIEILRNRLYEHKIQTLAQEYICNARDAMRELGKGNDFVVTMPTSLNPVFKVRDFGPGISPDRMANVFIKYGSSTKRDSNNQTGGFGIGAKSAWSYTDSFTITTFIDGTKRIYVAHIGVNNQGRLDHVSTSNTSENNGTEIQVPVGRYDIDEFRNAVWRTIFFWQNRPVLKGGESDTHILPEGLKIGSVVEVVDVNMVPSFIGLGYSSSMLAVIDGVPYPMNQKLTEKCKKLRELKDLTRKSIILHLNNGAVEVSASRESIADSKFTIEALEKIAAQGVVAIKTKIANDFGKVNSTSEFFKTYTELSPYFNVDRFAKYGDYEINGNDIRSPLFKKVRITHMHNLSKNNRLRVEKITKDRYDDRQKECGIREDRINDVFFHRGEENSIIQNKRLRAYFETKRSHVFLIQPIAGFEKEFDTIIADLNAKDFQSLTYVEKPREAKEKIVREKQEFCVHQFHGERHKYLTLADNKQKWFYVPMKEGGWEGFEGKELSDLSAFLRERHDAKVCGMAEKVLKKVQGDANFSPLTDWLKNYKPNKKQLAYVKMISALNSEKMELISRLKGIEDPLLVEMSKEYRALSGRTGKDGTVEHIPDMLVKLVKETDEYKEFKKKDEELGELLKNKYGLLDVISSYGRYHSENDKEIVIYLNAKFNG